MALYFDLWLRTWTRKWTKNWGWWLGWIENQKCCFFPLSQMNLDSTHKNKKVLAKEFFSKMHRFLRICIWSLQIDFQKLSGGNWFFFSLGHNFSQNGLIFAKSSLDCHIFTTLSIDTHIGYLKSHKAIWQLFGFMAV